MIVEMGLKHVSEDLKQGITVKSAKIHRYENRNKQFHQKYRPEQILYRVKWTQNLP